MKKLIGTKKQIKWAEDIRNEYLRKVEEYKEMQGKKLNMKEYNKRTTLQTILGILYKENMRADIFFEKEVGADIKNAEYRKLPREEQKRKKAQAKELQHKWEIEKLDGRLEEEESSYWIDNYKWIV